MKEPVYPCAHCGGQFYANELSLGLERLCPACRAKRVPCACCGKLCFGSLCDWCEETFSGDPDWHVEEIDG